MAALLSDISAPRASKVHQPRPTTPLPSR